MLPAVALLLVGCSPSYRHPELASYTGHHERIAVAPLQWEVVRRKPHRRLSPEELAARGEEAGRELQQALAERLQRRAPHLQVQDPAHTNAVLQRPPPADGPLDQAHKLGVDAIVSGSVVQTQALPVGVAVVLEALGAMGGEDAYAPVHTVDVSLRVHDGRTGELVWECSSSAQAEIGELPSEVADELLWWCRLPAVYRS